MPKVAGSAKLLWGAARDMPNLEPERKPVVLCGQQAPLDEMRTALGVERDLPGISLYGVRRLKATDHDQLERAAVVVYGGVVMGDLDASTRDDLRVVGRTQRPVLALLEALELPTPAAPAAGRVRGVAPTDVLPYRRGAFPRNLALERLAARAGSSGPWIASQVPALRPYICDAIIETASRRNAKAALLIFVPGADMPVLTAVQMRMVLQLARCYGYELSPDRAVELLGVLGAGFGFRAVGRSMLDFVPVAGWAVQSGVAYSGTKAVGKAAMEYFERGAVADVGRLRAFAEGIRVEVQRRRSGS